MLDVKIVFFKRLQPLDEFIKIHCYILDRPRCGLFNLDINLPSPGYILGLVINRCRNSAGQVPTELGLCSKKW
jgi:hypothetical protein